MALIKCPECGKDVSTSAEACPNCGYPVKKQLGKDASKNAQESLPKPKDISWIDSWKKKAKKTKIIWSFVFLFSIVALVISIVLLAQDSQEHDPNFAYVILTCVMSFITFLIFAIWLTTLFYVRVRARQFDGYTVLAYTGYKNTLVVEGVIQDASIVNRFLYGQLPNKKQVWVNISVWDHSVRMGLGKESDEKNII